MSAFSELWLSTRNFRVRFWANGKPPFEAQMKVLNEEYGEFVHECYGAALENECYNNDVDKLGMANEAADLIVTVLGACMDIGGLTLEDVEAALLRVAEKNDAKTRETHTINGNGKVVRK